MFIALSVLVFIAAIFVTFRTRIMSWLASKPLPLPLFIGILIALAGSTTVLAYQYGPKLSVMAYEAINGPLTQQASDAPEESHTEDYPFAPGFVDTGKKSSSSSESSSSKKSTSQTNSEQKKASSGSSASPSSPTSAQTKGSSSTSTPSTTPTTSKPSAPSPTPTPTPKPVPTPSPTPTSPWVANMSEEFNSLSGSIWNVRNNTYSSNEDSYLLSRNVSVGGGVLRVQGKLESAGGRSYTSGYIDSIGKYSLPNYFRAEVRAKVPFQQGMWAAPVWFRPEGGGDGEIDLIETYGSERGSPKIHQTIHTEYGATHRQSAITTNYSSVSSASAIDWHTYTMEKTKDNISMWTDGKLTARFTPSNPTWYSAYYEAGKRWNLRVNLQIGGSWGGLPDGSTNWSGDNTAMQLDYIRTWVLR